MSAGRGFRGFGGVHPVHWIDRGDGGDGMVPAHPRGTRVRRRNRRREPPAHRIHQWVGAAVGVTTGVAPVLGPALPPTAAVLSGVNRTSWACSVRCDRMPATSARSPRASACVACHAFCLNVTGFHVGRPAAGVVAVWATV